MMRDAFVEQLTRCAEQDRDIILITADLGFGIFDDFQARLSDQFLNCGVAEQNMTGLATGLALEGRKVFTYSIANFATLRCLEQIRNDACYHEVNVTIVASGGGFTYGSLGMSHHATEDLAIMRALPGVTVVAPADSFEARGAVSALAEGPGVGYLRIEKGGMDSAHSGEVFALGKARTLREGHDLTIIAIGGIVSVALSAAAELEVQGIECRVLSMHTLKPLDRESVLAAARQTAGILTLEEHNITGGLGGAVAETLLDAGVAPKAFRRLGLQDMYSSIVGSQEYLRSRYRLDRVAVVATVKKILNAQHTKDLRSLRA